MKALLEEMGLTPAEAKVYLSLFDLGTSTIGPIAKKSNVSYSKIQILLDKLLEKGLVSYVVKNNVKFFSPMHPQKILDYLGRKKADIEQQESQAKDLVKTLAGKMSLSNQEEKTEILEGYEGLKSAYDEGLAMLKKGDEVLVLGASLGMYTDSLKYKRFFNRVNLLRQEKGIKYRILYNENIKDSEGVAFWKKQKNTQLRFLLENTPASINIHANRTMIIYWAKNEPKVFLITSSVVTESFRKYFDALWGIGKKY